MEDDDGSVMKSTVVDGVCDVGAATASDGVNDDDDDDGDDDGVRRA